MVGRVGYAPTTPAMSMQYSTIELTAQTLTFKKTFNCFDRLGCFNFLKASLYLSNSFSCNRKL